MQRLTEAERESRIAELGMLIEERAASAAEPTPSQAAEGATDNESAGKDKQKRRKNPPGKRTPKK